MFTQQAEGVARPFPVTQVPHHQYDALVSGRQFVEGLQGLICKPASLYHRLFADGQCFEGFQRQVAEVAVVFLSQLVDFVLRFIGEGVAHIGEHHLFAVAQHAVENEIHEVGQEIQHRERQQRYDIEEGERYVVE